MQSLAFMKGFMIGQALTFAKEKWTKGYCVEVLVPGLGAGENLVLPNSQTQFTAIVRHKFENVELRGPVIATLANGQVSVNPSGSKVPAPATFTYKAPGRSGQKAAVNLVTRSKRGIATLDVKFTTVVQGWKMEGMSSSPSNEVKINGGISCDSPYGPWDFSVEYISPVQTSLTTTKIPFSADGKAIATVEEHATAGPATSYAIGTGNVTITPNSGGYQINFEAYNITVTTCAPDGCVTTQVPKPAWINNIIPADPGQCPQP
jgi:hypothetical protein